MNNIVLYCSGVETKNIIYLTEFSTALSVNEVVEPQKPMTIRLENAEQSGCAARHMNVLRCLRDLARCERGPLCSLAKSCLRGDVGFLFRSKVYSQEIFQCIHALFFSLQVC